MSRPRKHSSNLKPPRGQARQQNQLRIIGGRWRGLRVSFPDHAQLRPSPDRVRETLFNWLQPAMPGSRCLDLFAGSGALGLEAVSRGAAQAVLVERDARTVDALRQSVQRLGAHEVTVVQADASKYLNSPPDLPFSLVFLDPPYASGLLPEICNKLAHNHWLAPAAFIYLEAPADAPLPPLPSTWLVHRSRQAGQVGYHLLRS